MLLRSISDTKPQETSIGATRIEGDRVGGDWRTGAPVDEAGLWAAFLLAQARTGREPCCETELPSLVAAASGPAEVARGGAFLVGALAEVLLHTTLVGAEVDAIDVVAAALRRLHRADLVTPASLPFAAALLTAALNSRADPLKAIADISVPRLLPAVEVLAALLDLVDMTSGTPGAGVEMVAGALAGVPDGAPDM